MQAMAECSGPPQSTRKDVLGTFYPSPEPVDSSTPSSAPLSRRTLLRHSSFVRAVCVDAPVRICAGGDQRWSSLPRHQIVMFPPGGDRSAERAICDCAASWTPARSFRGARAHGASLPALRAPVFLSPHVLRPLLPRHAYALQHRPWLLRRVLCRCLLASFPSPSFWAVP